jgi:hypothetical protein
VDGGRGLLGVLEGNLRNIVLLEVEVAADGGARPKRRKKTRMGSVMSPGMSTRGFFLKASAQASLTACTSSLSL